MRGWDTLAVVVGAAILVGCPNGGRDLETDTDLLGDPAFVFCHDPDTDDPQLDRWCGLVREAPERVCPELHRVCAEHVPDFDTDTDAGQNPSAGCGGQGAGAPRAPQPPPPPPLDPAGGLAATAVQLVGWTVALLVAVAALGLLALAVRAVLGWLSGRSPAPQAPPAEPDEVVLVQEAPEAVPETPSGDQLAAARRALEEGRLEEATLLARGAALRALGEAGVLRIHRSRTDREYVRALRRDGDRQEALREVLRAVEEVRWAGRPVEISRARTAVEAAARLVGSMAPVLLAALTLLLATPARAQQDYDFDGDAALQPLYARWGFDAAWRLRTLRTVDRDTDVLVLDRFEVATSPEDEEALLAWVEQGGLLVLAGPLEALPALGTLEPVAGGPLRVDRRARTAGLARPRFPGGVDHAWSEARGEAWVVVDAPDGIARVVVQALSLGQGGVLAFSDPDLLTNGALILPDNRTFLGGSPWVGVDLALWRLADRPRLELATVAGPAGGANPFSAMADARLLPLVLQLLLVLAVAALWRGWPFAPLRDPPSEGRLAFADHARALGRRFLRAGATRHVASAQARLWMGRLGPVALRAAAERHGYPPEAARALVARVRALAEAPEGPDTPEDLKTTEELWRITRSR
jgi:hypothetical protein